jgi:uncharacterized membrane protein YqjE
MTFWGWLDLMALFAQIGTLIMMTFIVWELWKFYRWAKHYRKGK